MKKSGPPFWSTRTPLYCLIFTESCMFQYECFKMFVVCLVTHQIILKFVKVLWDAMIRSCTTVMPYCWCYWSNYMPQQLRFLYINIWTVYVTHKFGLFFISLCFRTSFWWPHPFKFIFCAVEYIVRQCIVKLVFFWKEENYIILFSPVGGNFAYLWICLEMFIIARVLYCF